MSELKRRDLIDRCKEIKPIKTKYRIISSILLVLIFLIFLSLILTGYLLVNYLQEPGDSKLSIIGFLIGIIALFPIYKYGKSLLSFKNKKIKKLFKIKIESKIKTTSTQQMP